MTQEGLHVELDTSDHDRKEAERLHRVAEGFIPYWREVHSYMIAMTDMMFDRLRHGGSFRGVTWEPFKSKYVARGGTHISTKAGTYFRETSAGRAKLTTHAPRLVRDRVLASEASLMQDTMNMRRNALTYTQVSPLDLVMGSKVPYAAAQNAMRKFVFFEVPRDVQEITTYAARYILTGHAKAVG